MMSETVVASGYGSLLLLELKKKGVDDENARFTGFGLCFQVKGSRVSSRCFK